MHGNQRVTGCCQIHIMKFYQNSCVIPSNEGSFLPNLLTEHMIKLLVFGLVCLHLRTHQVVVLSMSWIVCSKYDSPSSLSTDTKLVVDCLKLMQV